MTNIQRKTRYKYYIKLYSSILINKVIITSYYFLIILSKNNNVIKVSYKN